MAYINNVYTQYNNEIFDNRQSLGKMERVNYSVSSICLSSLAGAAYIFQTHYLFQPKDVTIYNEPAVR